MAFVKRNRRGAYTPNYQPPVYEMVKQLFYRGDTYALTAVQVKKQFRLLHFTRGNVAGIISAMRARGEITERRRGGKRIHSKHEVSLPQVGRSQ